MVIFYPLLLIDLAMGDQLEPIRLECYVAPTTASEIVASGCTPETLAICASFPDELESHLEVIAPGVSGNFQQKACFQLAWQKCQHILQQKPPRQSGDLGQDQLAQFVDCSWSESFPAKISPAIMTEQQGKFAQHYPSDFLRHITPNSKEDHRGIPWDFRLSQAGMEDIPTTSSSQVPRLEGLPLYNLLLEEPLSVAINNSSVGINSVRTMLDMVNTALALVESAHLASLTTSSIQFMSLLTQRLDTAMSLRALTIMEAPNADKQLWHFMAALISEQGWTLDQAWHELTHICGDMANLLQTRSRLPSSTLSPNGGKFLVPPSAHATHKGSEKKGKKGGTNSCKPGVKWVAEAQVDETRKQWCMRFQSNSCTFSDCKFLHACAVPKSDGNACLPHHAASQHDTTPHYSMLERLSHRELQKFQHRGQLNRQWNRSKVEWMTFCHQRPWKITSVSFHKPPTMTSGKHQQWRQLPHRQPPVSLRLFLKDQFQIY